MDLRNERLGFVKLTSILSLPPFILFFLLTLFGFAFYRGVTF